MQTLFAVAFEVGGSPTTWLEVVAFVLALAMVGCNVREIHWGWPLAVVSSLLYLMLFWHSRLYGDATLQVLFALMAGWGWTQWLRHAPDKGRSVHPTWMTQRARWQAASITLALWPLTALFLKHFTDTDVPWWDAFPTAASVLGQVLLARKRIENWCVWLSVNLISVGLFAYKGLWLTTMLYAVFAVLSLVGWQAWVDSRRREELHQNG
jgi:nicotinamide mononucleotide transporter